MGRQNTMQSDKHWKFYFLKFNILPPPVVPCDVTCHGEMR
jgi:hypothetical protein